MPTFLTSLLLDFCCQRGEKNTNTPFRWQIDVSSTNVKDKCFLTFDERQRYLKYLSKEYHQIETLTLPKYVLEM